MLKRAYAKGKQSIARLCSLNFPRMKIVKNSGTFIAIDQSARRRCDFDLEKLNEGRPAAGSLYSARRFNL